jgi:hypothetical protein
MIGEETQDHARRATLNRPRDAQAILAAIRELRSRGLGDYEIASATGTSGEYVRRVLGEHR